MTQQELFAAFQAFLASQNTPKSADPVFAPIAPKGKKGQPAGYKAAIITPPKSRSGLVSYAWSDTKQVEAAVQWAQLREIEYSKTKTNRLATRAAGKDTKGIVADQSIVGSPVAGAAVADVLKFAKGLCDDLADDIETVDVVGTFGKKVQALVYATPKGCIPDYTTKCVLKYLGFRWNKNATQWEYQA